SSHRAHPQGRGRLALRRDHCSAADPHTTELSVADRIRVWPPGNRQCWPRASTGERLAYPQPQPDVPFLLIKTSCAAVRRDAEAGGVCMGVATRGGVSRVLGVAMVAAALAAGSSEGTRAQSAPMRWDGSIEHITAAGGYWGEPTGPYRLS